MIQRVQSIFLALIAIAMITFLFVTIWNKKSISPDEELTLTAIKMIHWKSGQIISEKNTIWLGLLAFGAFASSVFSIFSYSNRMRQLQLGLVNSGLISVILGLIVYYSFQGEKIITTVEKGSYGFGLMIPAFALLCNMLANRFIRKDEEVVRSADRMR